MGDAITYFFMVVIALLDTPIVYLARRIYEKQAQIKPTT